ncbi:MAG: 30S ribosomal protein S16, partial [Candidatus Omnitrophota bacterium]
MAVVIRLKRLGTKKKPHSRIVVCESSKARDSREIDSLGYYDASKNPPFV